ncbi:hypothetical protein U9M48_008204 [Paspalum notatum var. saurae]|uniref:BHLH domain-containing protein n=1 Tax=Paspalum notatum var. saurae TaxID=547442 RepID=A0AAQ3SNK4_PASNO
MDSTANHQWLAELENEGPGQLDFIDPMTMQQLADSLADDLSWDQSTTHQEREAELDQRQQGTYATAGFSFPGGDISAGGGHRFFSFTSGDSTPPMSFSAREPKKEINASTAARCSGAAHEHVIAERKRREKMHHQFATLASIIPDITKTDKVSLLGSTIDYVHHLRGRLKALQEERHQSTGSTAESPPLDARCCIGAGGGQDDDGGASPTIEADLRGKTLLLRVLCREKKGVLIMVLKELEKHGLSIVNTSVLTLARSSLNITITAKIEDGSCTIGELG